MTTALDDLTVAYVGNFGPPHSTENHVATAFRSHGTTVIPMQENEPQTWDVLGRLDVDLVVWTRTWHLPECDQLGALEQLDRRGVPVVGFHLDRWWGLDREVQITGPGPEPFFRVPLLVTADGGHDDQWRAAGITHRWLPPGVSGAEAAVLGRRRSDYAGQVAFVGSHQGYHAEWPHRRELIAWLKTTYSRRCQFYPLPGRGAVRGRDLADLYQSVDVLVGDSCLAGGQTHYWSDRIPETLGRGGFLIHPDVEGLAEHYDVPGHLWVYRLGDFDQLGALIDAALAAPGVRAETTERARRHVLEHHTYERRVEQLVGLVAEVLG